MQALDRNIPSYMYVMTDELIRWVAVPQGATSRLPVAHFPTASSSSSNPWFRSSALNRNLFVCLYLMCVS